MKFFLPPVKLWNLHIRGFARTATSCVHNSYVNTTPVLGLRRSTMNRCVVTLAPDAYHLPVPYRTIIFTARCYAERGYATVIRLSVSLSVCP